MERGATTTVERVFDLARDRNVTFLAASAASYAFVSLIPLALLALVVESLVGGEAFAQFVVRQFESALSSSGQKILQRALTSSTGRTVAGVVGLVTIAWSALKLFRGLDIAFTEAYGTDRDPSLVEQITDGVVTILLIVVAVALVVGVSYVLGMPWVAERVPFPNLVGALVLIVGLVVAFLPLYHVLQPVDMTVREALPGAVVAAVGWVVLQVLFQLYISNAGKYRAYGVIGTVLLLLT